MPFWLWQWTARRGGSPVLPAVLFNRKVSTHSPNIVLRPYQESCLDACIDALKTVSRIGVSLPTGAGKTAVFISLLSRLSHPKAQPFATRSLVIVNSIELARQAATQAEKLRPDWRVEIEQGTKHKASGTADITIATYQTLLHAQRLLKFDPKYLKAVVVDEAHHAAAPSYRKILSHFDSAIAHPDPGVKPPAVPHTIPVIGFSATFSRHDGIALGSVFEQIVYHRDFLQMIREQWLCNVRFTTVQANIDLKGVTVNSGTGDFNPRSLAQVINTETVNRLIVRTWMDRADSEGRKSTLVFCVNLSHVRQLTDWFRSYGIDARYVYSGTPAGERTALLNSFKAGEFPVLVNCAILTEGADIPNVDCVVVARPTRSRNVFAQMIGRGMRLSPTTGKQDCRIIDFVDIMNRVSGIVCTPTLFGLDPREVVEDASIEDLDIMAQEQLDTETDKGIHGSFLYRDSADDIPEPTTVTYIDHDNPFSLVDQASGIEPIVTTLTRNAWVGCGDGVYVLECLGKGHIRIEPVEDDKGGTVKFAAHYAPAMDYKTAKAMKISMYRHNRQILTAKTLSDALRGADTFAAQNVLKGYLSNGLLRSAKWRSLPATSAQKAWLAKRWGMRPSALMQSDPLLDGESNFPDRIANVTKGEAANILCRLKHGAQARFAKKMKEKEKADNEAMKERLRIAREYVRVGPLPGAPASRVKIMEEAFEL